jgi:hypothetical protein
LNYPRKQLENTLKTRANFNPMSPTEPKKSKKKKESKDATPHLSSQRKKTRLEVSSPTGIAF